MWVVIGPRKVQARFFSFLFFFSFLPFLTENTSVFASKILFKYKAPLLSSQRQNHLDISLKHGHPKHRFIHDRRVKVIGLELRPLTAVLGGWQINVHGVKVHAFIEVIHTAF